MHYAAWCSSLCLSLYTRTRYLCASQSESLILRSGEVPRTRENQKVDNYLDTRNTAKITRIVGHRIFFPQFQLRPLS